MLRTPKLGAEGKQETLGLDPRKNRERSRRIRQNFRLNRHTLSNAAYSLMNYTSDNPAAAVLGIFDQALRLNTKIPWNRTQSDSSVTSRK